MPPKQPHRGFTLVEALIVIALIATLLSILLPALGEARRIARHSVCTANMRALSTASSTYAAANRGHLPSYSWRGGEVRTLNDGTLVDGSRYTDNMMATAQMCDIVRRRTGRTDIPTFLPNYTPYPLFSHLVLVDAMGLDLPDMALVCPEDQPRLQWAANPVAFARLEVKPHPEIRQAAGLRSHFRWAYSTSFVLSPAAWDPAQSSQLTRSGMVDARLRSGPTADGMDYYAADRLGGAKLSDVVFPSNKVFYFDNFSRHFTRKQTHFGLPESKQPLVFFDGSVQNHRTEDGNPGWNPNAPTEGPFQFLYTGTRDNPDDTRWLPDPIDRTGPGDSVIGAYKWTRGGLLGIDFGGGEINTGQSRR